MSLSVNEDVTKDYINPELWNYCSSNPLISLFIEKLCRHTSLDGVEDIESSILSILGEKSDVPSIESLKEAYKTINEISHDLSVQLDKDLLKEKLYFFKVCFLFLTHSLQLNASQKERLKYFQFICGY